MKDPMLKTMAHLPGERLDLGPYLDDFDARFWSVHEAPIWKIERQQDFRQPESPSWLAFSERRWEDSLWLLEDGREGLSQQFAHIKAAGSAVRRVRVVEEPFTPYLHWELHSLRLRAQCGEDIRVISPGRIAPLEKEHPVPEVVTLGTSVTYRLLYNARGVLDGAVRYTDPEVNASCRADIAALHSSGEDLATFFDREVAPL